jgi:hypothetical protein
MRLREDEEEDEEDVVALVLPLPLFARLNALAPLASGDDIVFFSAEEWWWIFEDANRRKVPFSFDDERVVHE